MLLCFQLQGKLTGESANTLVTITGIFWSTPP